MKFLQALKIGYTVLKKYELAAQAGYVPSVSIKGVPVITIDQAASAFVNTIKAAHDASSGPSDVSK